MTRGHALPEASGSGYVTDIPYLRGFYQQLAPAWLDFTATLSGIAPPKRGDGFSWCELGCGQGVTTALLAATHPKGEFVGIDLLPQHIDHARRFTAEIGSANVRFHAASFADERLGLPQFDYIVAHGVYSWVDDRAQAGLRRFIERHLRPGGLVYLSYNAMPGWNTELPFQRLLLALARDLPGDSAERFRTATKLMRPLVAAGAPNLATSRAAADLDAFEAGRPLTYLVHEYLTEHWRPLYVTEVRDAMAGIGLTPAGSATLADNFDDFVLRRAERDALAAFEPSDLRELVRDFLMHKQFRRDVFSRGGAALSDRARRERLFKMRYALAKPAELVEFSAEMDGAGKLNFDNETTRAIVAQLANGPRALGSMPGIRRDLVANMMALCASGVARPVESSDASVAALNHAIRGRLAGTEPIIALAVACGTAIHVDTAILQVLRDGDDTSDACTSAWLGYATTHATR